MACRFVDGGARLRGRCAQGVMTNGKRSALDKVWA
jgi:hypothetical protein